MSNNDESLQLYLKLDEIKDGKVIDTSGNKRSGDVIDGIKNVDDDFLGKCLQFRELDDEFEENIQIKFDQEILTEREITVSFWVNFEENSVLDEREFSIIISNTASPDLEICKIFLPAYNNVVYFKCGISDSDSDSDEGADSIMVKEASKQDFINQFANQWSYWAFTKDTNKEMKIYLNGQLYDTKTDAQYGIAPVNNIRLIIGTLKPNEAAPREYVAKLAHFRIYSRALSPQEIKRDLALSIAPELEDELNELRNLKKTKEGEHYDNWPEISKHFGLSAPE